MYIFDTREQKNQHIINYFKKNNIEYKIQKIDEGDYKFEDNDTICVERKGNLNEIMANITQARFKRELERAKQKGVKLIVLIENSSNINSIDDIPLKWKNPRLEQYKRTLKWKLNLNYHAEYNEWELYRQAKERGLQTYKPPQSPEQLRKALHTIEENKEEYDVSFEFCSKSETGQKIIDLLSQK